MSIPDTMQDLELIQLGLLTTHKHFLTGPITYENCGKAIQWILFEHTLVGEKIDHLTLYINSPGGDLYSAFGLIDVMRASKFPIYTVGLGNLMSAALMIFACGAQGHRYIGKNTGVMMHQFHSDMEGKAHELEAAMEEVHFCKDRTIDILTKYANIPEKFVREKLFAPSDAWLTAQDAIKYKLADKIYTTI